MDGWRRLGRFLVVELPIYRGAANWLWRTSSRLLGLRRRVAVVSGRMLMAYGCSSMCARVGGFARWWVYVRAKYVRK